MLTANQIRQKFIDYWTSKPRDHQQVPNMSLVPNVDSTLLFVNSGMFPLVPYLSGQPHPLGKRICNVQRCVRTEDIEEVGDNRHHTMFEMVGNWSLGDYFKKEQLPWVMSLFVDELELDINRIYVSVFKGNDVALRDEESIALWKEIYKSYGLEAEYTEDPFLVGQDNYRIFGLGKDDNWWQRGEAVGELGGPSSEMFYDLGEVVNPAHSSPIALNDDSGRYVEFGNSVFLQYQMNQDLKWQPMKQKNVDFGGGFERIVSVVQGKTDNYDTDLFQPIISKIAEISGKTWKDESLGKVEFEEQNFNFRAVADHIRAATFLIADGVEPGNKEQSYILRRLIRRMVRKAHNLGIERNFTKQLAEVVVSEYSDAYPHLTENADRIYTLLEKEENQFRLTVERGTKELEKLLQKGETLTGKVAFDLYQTYGFPLEMILEELGIKSDAATDIRKDFQTAQGQHSDESRAGSEQKFKGGLADSSETVTKLHTAHHLLLAALRKVLGDHVHQRGSNITAERLRIDFSHPEKVIPEQLAAAETLVNQWIDEQLEVRQVMLPREIAETIGAQMEFGQKYPDTVSVYFVGGSVEKPTMLGDEQLPPESTIPSGWISAEFCGGPHMANTSDLAADGKKFKILKEESSSAGVRRIKATLA